jgi:hypothetical protein
MVRVALLYAGMLPALTKRPVTVGFTPLLAKDSTNDEPGRVINISSIAGFSPIADRSRLAGEGRGLWSCLSCSPSIRFTSAELLLDHTSKAAGTQPASQYDYSN